MRPLNKYKNGLLFRSFATIFEIIICFVELIVFVIKIK